MPLNESPYTTNILVRDVLCLAERVRFELTVAFRLHWISSPAHSTTLPPLQVGFRRTRRKYSPRMLSLLIHYGQECCPQNVIPNEVGQSQGEPFEAIPPLLV